LVLNAIGRIFHIYRGREKRGGKEGKKREKGKKGKREERFLSQDSVRRTTCMTISYNLVRKRLSFMRGGEGGKTK
jgi:hypothetical protein